MRDAFDVSGGAFCPKCGDPNGCPCSSCGYGMRRVKKEETKPDANAATRVEG